MIMLRSFAKAAVPETYAPIGRSRGLFLVGCGIFLPLLQTLGKFHTDGGALNGHIGTGAYLQLKGVVFIDLIYPAVNAGYGDNAVSLLYILVKLLLLFGLPGLGTDHEKPHDHEHGNDQEKRPHAPTGAAAASRGHHQKYTVQIQQI
jgi:hypothetical protein